MKRVLEFGSLAKNNGAIEMNAATYINPTNRFTKIRHDLLPVFWRISLVFEWYTRYKTYIHLHLFFAFVV